MSTKAFVYLRTSSDDAGKKAGIPVQRDGCVAFAAQNDYELVQEFVDDGITGKLPMIERPQGKLLVAALFANGVRTVICYDSKRIGRTQPAFWSFAGLCRDNKIALIDCEGNDLLDPIQGAMRGMMSEIDRNETMKRLNGGKARGRKEGRRVEGKPPYGYQRGPKAGTLVPHVEEQAALARLKQLASAGLSGYRIALVLNAEGHKPRQAAKWSGPSVVKILERGKGNAV